MLSAARAKKQATQNAKRIAAAEAEERRKQEEADQRKFELAVKCETVSHRERLEKAINEAVAEGKKGVVFRFSDNDPVYSEVRQKLCAELGVAGYDVKLHFDHYEWRGSDDSPEETCYYCDVTITWE